MTDGGRFVIPANAGIHFPNKSSPYGFAGTGDAGAPGVPKSIFGASRDSGLVAVKYFRSFAPVIYAVNTAGNWRM